MKIAVLGKSAAGTPTTSKDAAFARSGSGDVQSDGLDRPVHVSRHHGRVPDHADQLNRRDLVHAGDARFRPDHESAPDVARLRRHYRDDHSASAHHYPPYRFHYY